MKTSFDKLRNRAFNKRFILALLVALVSATGVWAQAHEHVITTDPNLCDVCHHTILHYYASSPITPTRPSKLMDANGEQLEILSNIINDGHGRMEFNGQLAIIGNGAFKNITALTGDLRIPSTVTTIVESAFEGCTGLNGRLTIPKGVTLVGDYAFKGCTNIKSVSIDWEKPSSISLGTGIFADWVWNTQTLYVPAGCRINYVIANIWSNFEFIKMKSCATHNFSDDTHSYCPTCDHSFIYFESERPIGPEDPSTMKDKNGNTLELAGELWLSSKETLEFYGKLAIIGDGAFKNQLALKNNLTIPNTVTTIGQNAFSGCTGLTGTLTIPNSVREIGTNAFANVPAATVVVDWDTPITVNANIFSGWNLKDKTLAVSCFKSAPYYEANVWKNFGTIDDHKFAADDDYHGVCTVCNHGFFRYEATAKVEPSRDNAFQDQNYQSISVVKNTFANGKGVIEIEKPLVAIGISAFEEKPFTGSMTFANTVKRIEPRAFHNCTGFTGDLILPNSIEYVGPNSFENCGFKGNLVLSNSMTQLYDSSFSGCGFTGSLTLGNSISEIRQYAFKDCKFTGNLTLPASLNEIYGWAFKGCTAFTGDLVIPDGVKYIGSSAFEGCTGFNGALTIGRSLEGIDNNAFRDCSNLTGNLNIPNSVKTIGTYAFANCSKLSGTLTIPSSVISIGEKAFSADLGFTTVAVDWDTPISIHANVFDGWTLASKSLAMPCSKCSPYHYAEVWRTFGTITDHSWYTGEKFLCTTCHHGFFRYEADAPVTPKAGSLKNSGGGSLQTLYNFVNDGKGVLEVEGQINTIGEEAFKDCTGLKGNLRLSVKEIQKDAFKGCTNLTGDLTFTNSKSHLGTLYIADHAFENTAFTGTLTIPNVIRTIGDYAFAGCHFTGDLVIPGENYLVNIGKYAFAGCTGFTGKLSIGNGDSNHELSTIQEHTFDGCTGFAGTLTLPNRITEIGAYAFNKCNKLTGDLIIPNTVTKISEHAFSECYEFNGTFQLSNTLQTIGDYAFYYAGLFDSDIVIPNSVTSIGESAFRQMGTKNALHQLVISNALTEIKPYTFYNFPAHGNLVVPGSVKSIGAHAFGSSTFTNGDIIISDGVETIGESAFENVTSEGGTTHLFEKKMILPSTLKSVGDKAFQYCKNLANIEIHSIPQYGSDVFMEGRKNRAFTLALSDNSYISTIANPNQPTFDAAPTYTRTMSNKWGTVVVPFTVNASGTGYDFYAISSISDDVLTLSKMEGTVAAGTPALVLMNEDAISDDKYVLNLTATNTDVDPTAPTISEKVGNLMLKGSYAVNDITSEDGYIISNNKFWSIQEVKGTNNVYNAPFRAYIASDSPAQAKQLNIRINGEELNDVETITAITEGEAEYYDLNGRKLNTMQKGVNIVKYSNGITKKVIIK